MFATLFAAFTLFSCTTVAQQTPTVVCVPGQCLQGFSNTTIGAVLSAPGSTTDIHLLPGQYSSSTSPQLLHNLLTSASATLSPSAGFNGTLSLPLNLALQPGVTIYSNALYSGHAGFSALPNTTLNSSVPLTARSLSLSSNVWIATTSGPSNQRTIIWNSIPDFGQLPFTSSNTLSLVDIQSTAGPSNCLACSSSTQVLRAGSCVAANCQQTSAVLPGLGVCLSELVDVPQASGTSTSVPLPTITGIDTPTAAIKRALPWWQILLMALGCALIFLIIGFSWRCCAKRQRAKETIRFATTPGSKPKAAALVVIPHETESIKLMKLRAAEEARHENDMDQIIAEYEYDRSAPSPPGESSHQYYHRTYDLGDRLMPGDRRSLASSHSDPSIYSHVTGVPRKVPEPRQPLKKQELTSRFSMSTYMSEGRHLPARESRRNRFWK
ncbi:hypothetical protein H0H81_010383 [Sphagnurus paluster]|uniref:Uncharacterized protein n=1 Tax=Sphagnurus paluster TaxID=117069 RepID=A0A9P7K8G8_9AGAR|nr:hypothetical protein H0H81_010383 [Sphagnurus paluster]